LTDANRLDFALQRELDRETGGLDIPETAVRAIKDGVAFLKTLLITYSKAASSPFVHDIQAQPRLAVLPRLRSRRGGMSGASGQRRATRWSSPTLCRYWLAHALRATEEVRYRRASF